MKALGLTTIGLTIDKDQKQYKPSIEAQYSPKNNISKTNTLISSVFIDNHKNVSDMCNNIKFDQDEKSTPKKNFHFQMVFLLVKKYMLLVV